jgi:flagellar hook-basal body complex protein FliE
MTTTALNAAGAYGAMARLANRGAEVQTASGAATGATDFAAMIKEQVGSFVAQGNATEAKQADLMAGKADLIDVVTAVSETELALETMVSVRDRVISAYEDIMRMPI